MQWFKFLGILFGIAIRTKKPLALPLAPIVWKLLAGIAPTSADLEEVAALAQLAVHQLVKWGLLKHMYDSEMYSSAHAYVSTHVCVLIEIVEQLGLLMNIGSCPRVSHCAP